MAKKSRFFIIPGTFDLAGFSDALKGLSPEFETPAAARPFDLLDCHDQSLRAEGQLLIEADGALQLLQADGDVLVQACSGKGKFVQDLPDGPVKRSVEGVPQTACVDEHRLGPDRIRQFCRAG